jgi:[protein-PII] uridylyltransferase
MEDPSYVTTFSPEEIREHLEMVIHRPLVRSQFRTAGDVTEVTIVARDAPFALARFCGILSANDANILDARIFTRRDGIIIDRFRVADFVAHSLLAPEQCERIRQELEDVFSGRTLLQDLLARHRAKWKRRSVPVNPNIRLDAAFEDHPRYTIIDVFAADTLGFLYRITETISRLGLNIAFAKISSRTDGIVDSFYVTDENGRRITDAARLETIRQELLRTVRETAEKELVIG